MGTIYFTSDLHFSHQSILKPEYTDRGDDLRKLEAERDPDSAWPPSDLIERHNQWIIDTINSRVTKADQLYILGDLAFDSQWQAASLIDRLNGHRRLIPGNHDERKLDFYAASGLFESVTMYAEVVYNKKRIILFHYPIAEWNAGHHSSWHLHGHTHGNFDYAKANLQNKRILDVGWDNSKKVLGYYGPFSFEQIENYMDGRESIEHHGNAD